MRIPGASAESEFSDTAERTATALALWRSERGFAAVVIVAGWLLKVRDVRPRPAETADLLCALPLLVRAAPAARDVSPTAAVEAGVRTARGDGLGQESERRISLLARAIILCGDDGGRDGADRGRDADLGCRRDGDGAAGLAGRAGTMTRRCTCIIGRSL